MTKRQLLELLAPFADDQYVYVCLYSNAYPNGGQIIIQGVESRAAWHGETSLIALLAHDQNGEVPS